MHQLTCRKEKYKELITLNINLKGQKNFEYTLKKDILKKGCRKNMRQKHISTIL